MEETRERSPWRIAAAAAVIFIPALIAVYLSRPEPPTPRVSQILSSDRASDEGTTTDQADSPAAGAEAAGKKVSIVFKRGSRAALGTIEIPAIDLRTRFFDGVTDEAVEKGPGHWPGTPWPGQTGNAVFAGHRTTFTRPFEDLDLLAPGDRVRTDMPNARPTIYRVFKTTVVPEERYVDFVLRQPQGKRARTITLFACTPKGQRTHRIVVQAKATPSQSNSKARERGGRENNSSS